MVVIGTSITTTVLVGPSHLPNHVRSAFTKGMTSTAAVDVYWLPLGAGDASHCVRWNGRVFEAAAAAREHRRRQDLYHSALEIRHGEDRFVIEMAPLWATAAADRGVVSEGAVVIGLGGAACLRPVVSQGCEPIGEPWTITGSERNIVKTIGGRPAYQVRAVYRATDGDTCASS